MLKRIASMVHRRLIVHFGIRFEPSAAVAIGHSVAVKGDVAEIVAGINAKDIDKATKFDAPDLISMEEHASPFVRREDQPGRPYDGIQICSEWHLSMIDEAVDVAKSGDMAVYRSTYSEDSLRDGVPYTHKGN